MSVSAHYWVGTSGYNYPEWRGTFYPDKISSKQMLPFYASQLSTVEVNYTFYRLPTERVVQAWADATPDRFRFTLKAPRRITHEARLQRCEEVTQRFCGVASVLGGQLAGVLFQLPPSFKKDVACLRRFLDTLPPGTVASFEFRHESWHDESVFDCLRERGAALCVADAERLSTPVVITASHAYFRLRDMGYTDDDVARWANTIRASTRSCTDVYAYFKHEDEGKGAALARTLLATLDQEA